MRNLCLTLVIALASTSFARNVQSLTQPSTGRTPGQVQPGLVVERVSKGLSGDKAELREGDLLLGWNHGDSSGAFDAPVELSNVEIEQRPLGKVAVTGLRGAEAHQWILGAEIWGLRVRPNFSGEMLASYQRADDLAKAGKMADALSTWRSLADSSPSEPRWLRSWFYSHAALAASDKHLWKECDENSLDALNAAHEAGPLALAQLNRSWAGCYFSRSDWPNAEKKYKDALAALGDSDSHGLFRAIIFESLGASARYQSHLDESEAYWQKALALQQKLAPASMDLSSSFIGLGTVANEHGDLSKAEGYWKNALEISRSLGPSGTTAASTLVNLGSIARQRGDLAQAEAYYREAIDSVQNDGVAKRVIASSLHGLGNVAMFRHDLVKAEEYDLRALKLDEEISGESADTAGALTSLGSVVEAAGDLKKAEDYLRRALAIREKTAPGSKFHGEATASLAALMAAKGDLDAADLLQARAVEMEQKVATGSPLLAETYSGWGDILRDRGDFPAAEEKYRMALAIWDKLAPGSMYQAETLGELAKIAVRKKQPEIALSLYAQALTALEGQVFRLGGGSDVRSDFRARHASYYNSYAGLLISQNKPELAFEVLERSRARTLLETLASGQVNIRRGVSPALLDKARSLRADITAKSDIRIRLLSEKQHSEERVKALESEISTLLDQQRDVENQILASSPEYVALALPKTLHTTDVQQKLLDADTLLLEYSLGEDGSYLLAVSANSLQAFLLPKKSEIEDAARPLYETLARHLSGTTSQERIAELKKAEAAYPLAAARLSQMVLGPVSALLPGKRLVIVADGALQYIPFSMLPEPAPNRNAGAPVPLIVNHEVVNLPSASVLALLRQQHAGRKPAPRLAAVLADPVFQKDDPRVHAVPRAPDQPSGQAFDGVRLLPAVTPVAADDLQADLLTRSAGDLGLSRGGQLNLPRLLYSRQEAEAIRAITPAGEINEALDFQATRAAALRPELRNYRIIHFATHGLLNSEHPELSGLVFSLVNEKGQPQDGFLQLQDIYNLDLPADLVVLSACETGLGKEINGEGLIGLTRGFMYAGATRVVASLWNVSDVGTSMLMAEFYRSMEKDHLTPAAALRAAQIHMWKQKRWSSPYYWAAFQIQGEWK